MNNSPVISFRNVTVGFEGRTILDNVHFSLESDEFVYLIGATGSGKSSFLKLIYRDLIPEAGDVFVDGIDVARLKERKVPELRRKLGIVFQDYQLLPDRNIYDNVAFAMEVTGTKRSQIKQRVLEVLSMVGLSHRRYNMPDELSGGEQQRVVIARALANEPRILLADEPAGNLDPVATRSIMELLKEIHHRGMAVLMVTHNHDIVKEFPFRTIKIEDQKIREVNSIKDY